MYEVIPNRMKKMISVMLSIILVVSMTIILSEPKSVRADGVTVDLSKLTESETGEGYSYDATTGVLTITSGPIIITSSQTIITDKRVVVAGDDSVCEKVQICFSGLIIDRSEMGDSPFEIKEDSVDVEITLDRANSLKGGSGHAALWKHFDQTILTICGTGRLVARGGTLGAGIGGSVNETSGDIIINSGYIEAYGGTTQFGEPIAAGIGGGYKATGTVTINGGCVMANAVGGAGGSSVTITSGTLDCAQLSNAVIMGGSVKVDKVNTVINAFGDSLIAHKYSGYLPHELIRVDQLYGMADYDYMLHDIYANEFGDIYFWLPESVTATELATVTYQDGNNVVDSQLVIPGGKTIESDALSQDSGFLGWYDSSFTTKFDFSTPITGDLTLYAKRTNTTPSTSPTEEPTQKPTSAPTKTPTTSPTNPTAKPTVKPTGNPTTAPSNKPTAKPTSAPVKPTSVPSTAPSVKPTTAPADTTETGVAGFVERLYSVALNRESDPNGKADWINRITSGSTSGAEAARGFFMSQEFINSNHSDEEFLNRLYRTFFNREPDQSGFNNWLAQLKGGASRESVLAGFINSTEWANLCLTYGIVSGGTGKPNIVIQPNEQVVGFATRLYTTCLGREPDAGGLTNWSVQLANMQISGSETAHGFFFSPEFLEHNYSNDEYVTRLYRTFMNREPDAAGFADWTGRLANGATRESVFQGFAGSVEWAGICAEYGILK